MDIIVLITYSTFNGLLLIPESLELTGITIKFEGTEFSFMIEIGPV